MAGGLSRILSCARVDTEVVPAARMTIFLGRRLPDASSDLPGSRNGSGRSVSDRRHRTSGISHRARSSRSTLPPYLVLLPMGFAEPSRSPGLLVSSYLTVSPLPRPKRRVVSAEAVCFLWHFPYPNRQKRVRTVGVTHHRTLRSPDFPPRQVPPTQAIRWSLDETNRTARAEAPRRSSRPPRSIPAYHTCGHLTRQLAEANSIRTRTCGAVAGVLASSDTKRAVEAPPNESGRLSQPNQATDTLRGDAGGLNRLRFGASDYRLLATI